MYVFHVHGFSQFHFPLQCPKHYKRFQFVVVKMSIQQKRCEGGEWVGERSLTVIFISIIYGLLECKYQYINAFDGGS